MHITLTSGDDKVEYKTEDIERAVTNVEGWANVNDRTAAISRVLDSYRRSEMSLAMSSTSCLRPYMVLAIADLERLYTESL